MKKIRLPKLHVACGNCHLRPAINHIYFSKEEIAATDSHILAILKTADIFDKDFIKNMPKQFLLHKNQWKNFYTGAFNIAFEDNSICAYYYGKGMGIYKIKHEIINFKEHRFPNYKNVLPDESDQKEVDVLGINPFLLNKLLEAIKDPSLGDSTVKLILNGASKAISVSIPGNNAKGIIMPVILS
jgi:hypothetical protein